MGNRFQEAFGVRYPLTSAGMGMIASAELVAAVSNAGALGVLGCGPAPADWLRGAIREVRAATAGPFGVNLIHETTAFGRLTTDDHIAACVEEQVDLVVFFWQLPTIGWIDALGAGGIRFWVTAGDLETVAAAVDLPIHGVVLQGREAGGHVKSELPLAELLTAVREVHPELMLIGAGGIGDAAGVRRALELGADAVCLGTRFVACREANAHPEYQRRIVAARAADTTVTRAFGPEWPDAPMRVIAGRPSVTAGASIGTTQLFGVRYEMPPFSAVLPTRDTTGDFDAMCLAAGESVEAIRDVKSAAQIIHELFEADR